jgi:hypothetical protein
VDVPARHGLGLEPPIGRRRGGDANVVSELAKHSRQRDRPPDVRQRYRLGEDQYAAQRERESG